MKVTTPFKVSAADTNSRTISGRILEFGVAAGRSRRKSANCLREFGDDQADDGDDTPEAALLLLASAGYVPFLLMCSIYVFYDISLDLFFLVCFCCSVRVIVDDFHPRR